MAGYQGEKFKTFLEKNKISKVKAAEMLKIGRSGLYDYFKTANMSRETVQKILTTFGVSEDEIFSVDVPLSPMENEGNARFIGEIEDAEDSDGNTMFVELSPGRYRMKVDLVPNFARAGYLAGFEDPIHVEELPKHELTVTKYHKGKYLAFEVAGDSMFDGSIASVPDGCTVTAREVHRDHWKSKLHVHNYPYWVFVHRTEGILIKTIKSQNLETGEIILESLNPDKNSFPDKSIFMDDTYQILNVVKRELD